MESVRLLPGHTRIGAVPDWVAARAGRNIGVVAAARTRAELVALATARFALRRRSPTVPSRVPS